MFKFLFFSLFFPPAHVYTQKESAHQTLPLKKSKAFIFSELIGEPSATLLIFGYKGTTFFA